MQTILGSGGVIGTELAKALTQYTTDIKLVSRNPEKVNETDILLSADLLHDDKVKKAVEGSSVAYVTVGFPYNLKVWQKSWPKFMESVIAACTEYDCKLVFFDNMYMYDKDHLDGMDARCLEPSLAFAHGYRSLYGKRMGRTYRQEVRHKTENTGCPKMDDPPNRPIRARHERNIRNALPVRP